MPELAADLADEHYAYRALKLSEVFILACAWESVTYTRIASVAMKNYKELFLKHDVDCFNTYLIDIKSGKKRITAGALLLHEIIASLGDNGSMANL